MEMKIDKTWASFTVLHGGTCCKELALHSNVYACSSTPFKIYSSYQHAHHRNTTKPILKL